MLRAICLLPRAVRRASVLGEPVLTTARNSCPYLVAVTLDRGDVLHVRCRMYRYA